MERRQLLVGGLVGIAASGVATSASAQSEALDGMRPFPRSTGKRCRVIIINDLAGDVDGLFATVHALLSPTTDIRGIIGAGTGAAAISANETARHAAARATEIVKLMNKADQVRVFEGAPHPLTDAATPVPNAGTQAIIDEALRSDTDLPLYVTVGCGLTEVASALMIEPRIAGRFTLVWIGGQPLANARPIPPGPMGGEYNFSIDRTAAQVVYNHPAMRMWQVPNAAYGACMVSIDEIQARVAPHGQIGRWLWDRLCEAQRTLGARSLIGETYTLGDSPLVLLTALTAWVPSSIKPLAWESTGSSRFTETPAPHLNSDGTYTAQSNSRLIRVYDSIDTRLLFEDFFSKMKSWQR